MVHCSIENGGKAHIHDRRGSTRLPLEVVRFRLDRSCHWMNRKKSLAPNQSNWMRFMSSSLYVREMGISSLSILMMNWNVSMWVTRSMLIT